MPTIVPTLSLIIGVLVMQTRNPIREARKTDRFVFRLAFWLSGLYLLLVSLTIFLGPIAESYGSATPLELMARSHLWLAPFQGIVAASLGAFFIREQT